MSATGRGDRHARRRQVGDGSRAKRVDPHRAGNVFDVLLAEILEFIGKPVADLVAHDSGNADPAGLGERFEARRDVDAVAEDVAAFGDDVPEIDADAKFDALLVGQLRLAVDHPSLSFGGTANRVDDAREFDKHPIAGGLDDTASVLPGLGLDQLPVMCLQPFVRAFLVGAHQARIPRHIQREDRGETAGRGRSSKQRARKRPLHAVFDRQGSDR